MLAGMPTSLDLAAGLRTRPLDMSDVGDVYALIAACEREDLGQPLIDLEDVISDWQRPSRNLATDTIGVFADGDTLVACAEVTGGRRAEGWVAPEHRGRGIGSQLLRWTEQVARAGGGTRVGQTVPENGSADRLLRAYGYQPLWESWMLELPAGRSVAPPPALPDGVRIRSFQPGQDERAAYQTIEDAFNEWPNRSATAFEDWAAGVLRRPGFEPWQLLLAVEDDAVIGACSLTMSGDSVFVSQLAVRHDRRGLGLGRALLLEAFAAGRRHGANRAELSTDSRTGALGIYLHVGMEVTSTFVHLARQLD